MTLSREAMMELMAYADDELDGEGRARVDELLRPSVEARGVIDAMGTLGEVVRQGVEDRGAASARGEGNADGVMAAIAREPAAAGGAKVVSIAQARRPRAGAVTAAFVVLALAGGLVLMLRSKPPAPVAAEAPLEPSAPAQAAPAAAPGEPTAVAQAAAEPQDNGVDLEEVQSTKNKVNVFFVPPAARGAMTSVVVWIDDRPGTH